MGNENQQKLSGNTGEAVAVRHVSFSYPRTSALALSDISLSIQSGHCYGLLGPNGAGKTTLLSMLIGLQEPSSGQVFIGGKPASRQLIKQACAIVPQDYAFYPMLTGAENLDFFAGLYGLAGHYGNERIAAVVDICGLQAVLNKMAGTYSGGVKRRLNLAIGLLNEPAILYLDEPTVGIDAQSRHFILQAINDLKKSGMTVVYTSHYMEEVEAICDEIAIIDQGKLLVQSSLAELLSDDNHQLTRIRLAGTLNSTQLAWLETRNDFSIDGLTLSHFAQAGAKQLGSVLVELDEQQIPYTEVHHGGNRLEDIYLTLTRTKLRE